MSALVASVFAVMLLADPNEAEDVALAVSVSEDAARDEQADRPRRVSVDSARITSRTSDFDRKEGVAMFEGNVVVRYSEDYVMCSDRLYMFMSGTNELSRVVAAGHVAITNESRVGTCAMATYRRRRNEIEMFGGDDPPCPAMLMESGDAGNVLEGSRIKFWLDSEQVEVENSRISVEQKGVEKLQ